MLDYYIETPLYKLFVSDQSTLREHFDEPFEPGEYDAITAGYFLLLTDLEPETYRMRFGGKGKGGYVTDSIYDVVVLDSERQSVREVFLGAGEKGRQILPSSFLNKGVVTPKPRKEMKI